LTDALPTISIVTPSLNQAEFLEETIQSVLGQDYPRLEYIIIDGGSTDGSLEIIKRFEKQLTYWVSARDGGMYNAVNIGFQHATGDLRGWLNSDDFYFPGTLSYVAAQLNPANAELLFGNAFHFKQGSAENWGSDVVAESQRVQLQYYDYIIQPATFWTRAAWDKTGTLDESFQYSGDWDWLVRAQRAGVTFKPTARYLAAFRVYPSNKTLSGREKRWRELTTIMQRYAGHQYAETFADVIHARDSILRVRQFMRRWRLTRLDPFVFRLLFPRIFSRYSPRTIWDMIETIGYS